ncbi:hypothetical protein GCM10009665_21540 [Kitasatospora nipponensis]|uniref:PBP domain-containing protein n=1 Tax=Kitasatospora nipponensis TaxID=258049 RepID=A0ABP4GQJ3_9ACTN
MTRRTSTDTGRRTAPARPRASLARRALRTALTLTVVLTAAAGVALSGGSPEPPQQVAATGSAGPSIAVDPVTSTPVPLGGATGTTAAPAADSAPVPVTVKGSGAFANLEVTVAQTTHLVDQVVAVSWKGGTQTKPSPMSFGQDFLEVMQCWGDAPTGPDRTQCQYGGLKGDGRGGGYVPSRQLNYGRTLSDPAEPLKQTDPAQNVYVPFAPVTGDPPETGANSAYFDAQATNEVPFAPTRSDGTGQLFFEMQTGQEAPGLGCGQTPVGRSGPFTEGRACWLVIVPRGELEVDGKPPVGNSSMLQSSPLSTTNWNNRLVVPLHFEPIGVSCPIGSSERPTLGTEVASEAVSRWQPVLCQQSGRLFNYLMLPDTMARRKLTDLGSPGLVYLGKPLAKADQTPGRTPLYAPLTISGLTIAFDIESQSYSLTPDDKRKLDGQRIPQMSLTPRLVAKLLTQSYQYAVSPGDPDVPKGNPLDLTSDPEFLALNPQFAGLYFPSRIPDLLLPSTNSDTATAVWQWLLADPDAKAFLSGQVSPQWHDSINPNYLGGKVDFNRDSFPKADGYCQPFPDDPNGRPPWCTFDSHPFSATMLEGARASARGDTLAKSVWDATTTPGSLKKGAPQAQGLRGVMAVTTTALADRFGLNTAKLLNPAGKFVGPDTDAMLAEAAAATPAEPGGVPVVDPTAKVTDGYPLTTITYAATVPSALSASDGASYAELLRYAAGPGQQTGVAAGQLPDGYAPLPQAMRDRLAAAAQAVQDGAGQPDPGATGAPTGPPPSSIATPVTAPSGAATPATTTAVTNGTVTTGTVGQGGVPVQLYSPPPPPPPEACPGLPAAPLAAAAPAAGAQDAPGSPAPSPTHSVVTLSPTVRAQSAARTVRAPVGGLRYVLFGALVAGLLAAAGGFAVPRLMRGKRS